MSNNQHAITGLQLSHQANILFITDGVCRDALDAEWIQFTGQQTLDPSVNGLGGLDAGTLQADSAYAVYAVKSTSGTVGAILSASFDPVLNPPTWPGSVAYRRIGSVMTDGNADVRAFTQTGTDRTRVVTYSGGLSSLYALQGGAASAWTDVDLNALAPRVSEQISLFLKANGGATLEVKEPSASHAQMATTSEVVYPFMVGPIGPHTDYRVPGPGTGDIAVLGYQEQV